MDERLILGIESSCDETAAAVYSSQRGIISSELFSQIALHKQYGGVVPEIASRSHLEKITPITHQALEKASCKLADISAIAVTYTPGLPGSLLVGLNFAKALAYTAQKSFIGVNHLEGHIFSACIEHKIPFPFLCITASGGHTALYLVQDFGVYSLIGHTLDDAAGEAFDKISKLIGLGYPGGPIIETYAQQAGFVDFFKYPRPLAQSLDFSFSGLKTAILYDLIKRGAYDTKLKEFTKHNDRTLQEQISSSLLVAITDVFKQKINLALKQHPETAAVAFVGGVACNKFIKSKLQELCTEHNLLFFSPSAHYCTDNAAMIAFVGNYKAQQGLFDSLNLDIR